MSESVIETEADLKQFVDELATRLVLDGPTREFVEALVRLSERAETNGYHEAAQMASGLARTIGEGASDASLGDSLGEEISKLKSALDNEQHGRPVPTAAEKEKKTAPLSSSLAQDPELVAEFIMESREHLTSVENRMLLLEQNPADMEAIHSVFRGFHTIKGLAGFLEFADMQEVSHEVETLLDLARNSKLAITPAVVDIVLASADYLKQALAAIEAAQQGRQSDPVGDIDTLISRIRQAMAGDCQTQQPNAAKAPAAPPPEVPQPASPAASAPTKPKAPTPASPAAAPPKSQAAPPKPQAAPPAQVNAQEGRVVRAADTMSIRVETGKLDSLMDMVGEMVIAQSLIRHNPKIAAVQDTRLQGDLSQLARITSEVQRTTMGMRMIPIGQLFQRTARLVRDLSRKAGRQVELETKGEDTELDKTIAEELADPLMHMVRNSIDHGIEPPAERAAAGKSATAHVRLAAYHQAGQIIVEISDDGRGLDREKILNKARQKGLVEEGAQLADAEIFRLIFEPGFSTAAQVTDISGRGVGMDVVRKHVQKLRGRIDIQSQAGQGTTFSVKLPLTLAIIEGLVVVVGHERYIVPIYAVREMFRPAPDAIATVQGRSEMVLVRGNLLPVIRLHERFGVKPRSEDPKDGVLVVAECEGRQFCLLVDDLVGKQEVVIKSLGESLKNIPGIAGCSILGDGRVGLILDLDGVFRGVRNE